MKRREVTVGAIAGWAAARDDVRALALAGSWARGNPDQALYEALEVNGNTFDLASCFLRFLTPASDKLQQCALISSIASFFHGWRSTPGTMPATSQLDKLISIAPISVLSCFRTIREWFISDGSALALVSSIGSHQRRWIEFFRRCPIASRMSILLLLTDHDDWYRSSPQVAN